MKAPADRLLIIKRTIALLAIFDNFLLGSLKRIFTKNWKLAGACRHCGSCCRQIYLKMTPTQSRSPFFTAIFGRWLSWLYGLELLETDRENHYLVFRCRHLRPDNLCGNYRWRPPFCRNLPLVDYFDEPKLIPGCGFRGERSGNKFALTLTNKGGEMNGRFEQDDTGRPAGSRS